MTGIAAQTHLVSAPVARASSAAPRDPFFTASAPADAKIIDATQLAEQDPLATAGPDGWSPQTLRIVASELNGGIAGSAVSLSAGGVVEKPGQRLTVTQVDALAPYFADTFGLDEAFVRAELAKVYVYTGGPSTTAGQAMTVGHHVYMPTPDTLRRIMSPAGKRWLVHELAHTMQYVSYDGQNRQTFLANYIKGLIVGRDPEKPGQSGGAFVWGALFTGWRSSQAPDGRLGQGAVTTTQRLGFSVVPGLLVGSTIGLSMGGALMAARATSGREILGRSGGPRTIMLSLAVPTLVGATAGAFEDKIGKGGVQLVGGLGGAAVAAGTLWSVGAFASRPTALFGKQVGLGMAAATILGAGILGFMAATTSANSIRGWSKSSDILWELENSRHEGTTPAEAQRLPIDDALHDAHWVEIDAETIAQRYVQGDWTPPADGKPIAGRVPLSPDHVRGDIDTNINRRLDWGLWNPLIIGAPAAVATGAGVLALRTGRTVVTETLKDGVGPLDAVRAALLQLGSARRGVTNSLMVGASATLAPLAVGGFVGPIAYDLTGSTTVAQLAGAAAGAFTAATLVSLLLRGGHRSLTTGLAKVGLAATLGGAAAALSAGVATGALIPERRTYSVSA